MYILKRIKKEIYKQNELFSPISMNKIFVLHHSLIKLLLFDYRRPKKDKNENDMDVPVKDREKTSACVRWPSIMIMYRIEYDVMKMFSINWFFSYNNAGSPKRLGS